MVEERVVGQAAALKGVKRINRQEMKKCDGDGARLALERHYRRSKLHGHQLQLEHPVLQLELVGGHCKNRRDCRSLLGGAEVLSLPKGLARSRCCTTKLSCQSGAAPGHYRES